MKLLIALPILILVTIEHALLRIAKRRVSR